MSREAKQDKTTVTQEKEDDLLSRILSEGRLARDEVQTERAKDMLAEFVSQVMQGQLVVSRDMEATINARIAAIDRLLSAQLNEILHHEEFQKLEGSWRGLRHLVMNSETGPSLNIRVFNASMKSSRIRPRLKSSRLGIRCSANAPPIMTNISLPSIAPMSR